MRLIAELLERLPPVKDFHMSSQGMALWIAWEGDLDNAVPQTLQDYGGMCIVQDRDQSLWFFFSNDVFLALARLAVWAQFNPFGVCIEVLPARLLLGVRREMSLSLDSSLTSQEVMIPKSLTVWVHPKVKENAGTIPGLTFRNTSHIQGMTPIRWDILEADARLPYTSSHGWYSLLRPLGNPLDKRFQSGWRTMFASVEGLLQKHKLKYNVHDFFLMLTLDNLRQMRNWTRDLLQLLAESKARAEDYWPCVSVIMDKKGLNFNNELPGKVGIKWDNLMPDCPYMSYRNAFLLGEGFNITDLHYSATSSSIDSWCTVALGEGGLTEGNYIPVLVAGQLVAGSGGGCFYCGMRSHESSQCPSKRMEPPDGHVWSDFANMSLDDINEAFRGIESALSDAGTAGFPALLEGHSLPSALTRTLFAINLPAQLRMIERLWLAVGREFPYAPADHEDSPRAESVRDDSPVWSLLARLIKSTPPDLSGIEKDIQAAISRNPRDARLRTLLGFVSMERGDAVRAHSAWKEGETLSGSGLHQSWHLYLLGRLLETQGRASEAFDAYQEVLRHYPQWRDAEYRQIVCRVKMGFAEQVQPRLLQIIDQDPTLLNRFLIDYELERGHIVILTALYPLWNEAKRKAEDECSHLERLGKEVDDWFPPDHPVANKFRERLSRLTKTAATANYLSFLQVLNSRPQIEKDIKAQILKEIDEIKGRFKGYLSVLEVIRDEASWFPFPRILVEFNKDFNECASIINWAFGANFHEPEAFKQAQAHIPTIVRLLTELEKRLRFLRVVRDSTLYMLILGRTFFWIEIVFLVICLVAVPSIAVFGEQIGMGWLKTLIRGNNWELQKVLLIIVSAMALGISVLRTTLVFEKKRDKLVSDARYHREEMQRQRLERIREQARKINELGGGRRYKPMEGPSVRGVETE